MIIKRSKLSISTFGFSNLMLIVIAAVAVGAVRFSMTMGRAALSQETSIRSMQ